MASTSGTVARQADRKRFVANAEASSKDQRLDQVRRRAPVEWEAMAPGWERRREYLREFSQGIADWMVAQLDPRPGKTILELGAGTGETGDAAARLIGDSGRLISTDLPPAMVEGPSDRPRSWASGMPSSVWSMRNTSTRRSREACSRWPTPDGLRELLLRAGFKDVRIEEMEVNLHFSDFEDFWSFVREFAGAVAILLRSFSDEERGRGPGGNGTSDGAVSNGRGLRPAGPVRECAGLLRRCRFSRPIARTRSPRPGAPGSRAPSGASMPSGSGRTPS
jgi:hypothetical protein